MRVSAQFALLALPLAGVLASPYRVSPAKETQSLYRNAEEAFRDLVNALPEESLHAALHDLVDFKDGVFESDRRGVEHVHDENPPLATKLIVAAVQDLKRRQNPPPPGNGTSNTPPPPPPSSSVPPPPETSEEPEEPPQTSDEPEEPPQTSEEPEQPPSTTRRPPIEVPVTITQTNDRGEPTTISSAILSDPTASAVVTITRTNDDGDEEVVTETKPAIVVTTTDSAGNTIETTSAVDFAPTPGQAFTTTDARGSVFVTTYTPAGDRVSSVKLITTTGPDGQQSVVTSYTYVDPAEQTGAPNPSRTGGDPGLQSGAGRVNAVVGVAMLGGALFAGLWI